MNTCSNFTDYRGDQIADALIRMFQHDGVSPRQAKIRAAISIGADPNTIDNWANGYCSPNKTHRRALNMLPGWEMYV